MTVTTAKPKAREGNNASCSYQSRCEQEQAGGLQAKGRARAPLHLHKSRQLALGERTGCVRKRGKLVGLGLPVAEVEAERVQVKMGGSQLLVLLGLLPLPKTVSKQSGALTQANGKRNVLRTRVSPKNKEPPPPFHPLTQTPLPSHCLSVFPPITWPSASSHLIPGRLLYNLGQSLPGLPDKLRK